MNDTLSPTRRTVLRALGAVGLAGGVSSAASAQKETPTATAEPTPDPGEQVVAELGEVVTLRAWEYDADAGTFSLTLTADYPSAIKITDTGAVMEAITAGDGAATVEIPSRGYTVEERTTVEFDAVEFDGAAALTVASTRGTVLIRTDSVSAGKPAIPYDTAGLMVGSAAVGTGYYSYQRGRAKLEEEDTADVERVA